METITLEHDDNGNPIIKVNGVKGGRCKDLTKSIEAILGGEVLTQSETCEYYETNTEQEHLTN